MSSIALTIVTVTFNNIAGLKRTLTSVAKLDQKNLEHVVIDGGSTDGSQEYLKDYSIHPIRFISQTDQGIYDAMNKGISMSKGIWINFMNAGDVFHDDFSLASIANQNHDLLYGSAEVNYNDGFKRKMQPASLDSLWKGMSFSHQSVFVKRELMAKYPFNLTYRYCADFDFIFALFTKGHSFVDLNLLICSIEAGGISDAKRFKATKEVFAINKKLNTGAKIYPYFYFKILYGYISVTLKKCLPKKTVSSITKAKYK